MEEPLNQPKKHWLESYTPQERERYKKKLSKAHLKRWGKLTEEEKKEKCLHLGKERSDDHKKKIGEARKAAWGKKTPEERKALLKSWGATGAKRMWTPEKIGEEKEAMVKWFLEDKNISMVKFAYSRGYSKHTLKYLTELDEDFKFKYDMFVDLSQERIAEGALQSKYHPGFAQFMLKCRFLWQEPPSADKAQTTQPIHVHLPAMPSSDLVPVRALQ